MRTMTESFNPRRLGFLIALMVTLVLVGYTLGNIFPILQNDQESTPVTPTTQPERVQLSIDGEPALGDRNAPIIMIEFIDFQCPFCRRFYTETLDQIKEKYVDTGKVLFVLRDFPISQIHPAAQKASEAVECAEDQGMWLELHDKIFDEQNRQGSGTITFGVEDLKSWAAEVELNTVEFNDCLDSGRYEREVQQDLEDGLDARVGGTPTFFIGNGEKGYTRIVGAQPYSVFEQMIESELEG